MRTIQQSAQLAGSHRWWELALWRVLGTWAPTTPLAELAVLFDTHAQHAAWRAEQWWDRLPVLAGVARDSWCEPPSPAAEATIEHLGRLDPPVARLAGAYRVALPRLVAAYGRDRLTSVAVAEGPHLRTLGQVEADALGDWRAGEAFLHLTLDTTEAVHLAGATVAALEQLALGDPPGEAVQRQADQQTEQRHPDEVHASE